MGKYKYETVIYWDNKDNAFIAKEPELPGRMADGPTYEGALKNVQVVIKEWIETAKSIGRDIPNRRG